MKRFICLLVTILVFSGWSVFAADVKVIKPRGANAERYIYKELVMVDRQPLAFTSGDTVKSFTINTNALTHTMILEMPSFSGAVVTGTFSIENSDGNEIYSESGLAENTNHVMFAVRPLTGDNTIKVTLSTDPLSSGTCYVSMYLTRGD